MTCGFLIQLVFCQKKTRWFIGVEVEQETSAPPPKKNPGINEKCGFFRYSPAEIQLIREGLSEKGHATIP